MIKFEWNHFFLVNQVNLQLLQSLLHFAASKYNCKYTLPRADTARVSPYFDLINVSDNIKDLNIIPNVILVQNFEIFFAFWKLIWQNWTRNHTVWFLMLIFVSHCRWELQLSNSNPPVKWSEVADNFRCDPVDHCGPRGPSPRITSQGRTKIFGKVSATTTFLFAAAGALAKIFF